MFYPYIVRGFNIDYGRERHRAVHAIAGGKAGRLDQLMLGT